MGFNTTVLFLNDAVHQLQEDKKFPEKLYYAILETGAHNPDKPIDVSLGFHANAVRVLGCAHADNEQVFGIGGNTGFRLGVGSCYNSEHRLLRTIAAQHGFRLVKDERQKSRVVPIECEDCRKSADHGTCYDYGHILDDTGRCISEEKCRGRR